MNKFAKILIFGSILLFVSCCASKQTKNDEVYIGADSMSSVGSSKSAKYDTVTYVEKEVDYQLKGVAEKPKIKLEPKPIINKPKVKSLVTNTQNKGKVGEIRHLVKDTMRFGVTDTVEVTVSYNCPKQIIQNEVQTFHHNSNVVTQQIKITTEMRARLIDPTGNSFKIVPITDTIQFVEMLDSTYTLWQWMVTPIKDGDRSLVLSVDMIVDNHKKSLKIYQDKIYVHIDFWTKFWINVKANWTYITYIIGGIFAIFGWLYKEKIIKIFKK